ncbi:MAG TPA: carbamate kinase [Clostridiales bacterium]|nr:carbamate kinase [Clostridiales bacterium]
MGKRIVVALGGNALGMNLSEQAAAARVTAKAIADLIANGHQVVITHGNGPQVGMIEKAFAAYRKLEPDAEDVPLSVSVAMSQAYIGHDLQNALREELLNRGIKRPVVTVLTHVVVDPNDPAFQKPTKPIGGFMTQEEAQKLAAETGAAVMEDAGRGWRKVVASPKPVEIIETDSILALLEAGQVVIAAGGGGIPVVRTGENRLEGVPAVIDKDYATEKLAEQLGADLLVILTAVEKVAVNFNKPDQKWLSELSPAQARRYIEEGHFAPGSMLPKVEAAVTFAESAPERTVLITLLEKAGEAVAGLTGTIIREPD